MNRPIRGRIDALPLSRKEVAAKAEALAERFLCDFWKGATHTKLIGINFDVVYEQLIYPEYGILLREDEDLGVDEQGEKIFGKYNPETNTAYVDYSLREDPRRVFTCWHEVGGHGILQGDWLRKRLRQMPHGVVVTTESMLSPETVNVLERQANIYASHAAVPTSLLALAILDAFDPHRPMEYRGRGNYTFVVNGQARRREVNDFAHFAWTVASFLQHRFGWISVEAISYRLLETPLLVNSEQKRFELHRTAKSSRCPSFTGSIGTSFAVPAFAY